MFLRFTLISLLAFGGGKAALSLIERVSVREQHWITLEQFGVAVALGYITPGPVLITATFIGHQAYGFWGAIAATLGVFFLPCVIATLTSRQLKNLATSKALKSFGQGSAPAIIGVLALLAIRQAQFAIGNDSHTIFYILITISALLLALTKKIHPSLIALGGLLAGFSLNE